MVQMWPWLRVAIVSASRRKRRTASGSSASSSGRNFSATFLGQPRVFGLVDDAHAAGAELAGDPIMADVRPSIVGMSAEYTALTACFSHFVQGAAADSEKNGRGFPAIIAGVLHAMSSPPEDERESDLLSDEPTMELVVRARTGDRQAVERFCNAAFHTETLGAWQAAARGTEQPRYGGPRSGDRASRSAAARHVPAPHVGAMQAICDSQ
jgi:hypothetical protein